MATFYGVNRTKNRAVPQQLAEQGEVNGRVHVMYDEYSPATVVANASVIEFGAPLPPGARVLNAFISFPDQGTTGTGILGWAATTDEVADPNGYMAAISFKAAADSFSMIATDADVPGVGKKFTAPAQTILTLDEAIDAGTGTIKVWLEYIID